MTIDIAGIFDAAQSHALATGLFEQVNLHEPDSPPRTGLTAGLWVDGVAPIALRSGLAATSCRVLLKLTIYLNADNQDRDAVDPAILGAVDVMMGAYTGDFDLNSTISEIDLLGQYGIVLGAQAGYVKDGVGRILRVMTLSIPCIINDAWTQAA